MPTTQEEFTPAQSCFDEDTCLTARFCYVANTIDAQREYGVDSQLDYLLFTPTYECRHPQVLAAILRSVSLLTNETIQRLQSDGRLPNPLPPRT